MMTSEELIELEMNGYYTFAWALLLPTPMQYTENMSYVYCLKCYLPVHLKHPHKHTSYSQAHCPNSPPYFKDYYTLEH